MSKESQAALNELGEASDAVGIEEVQLEEVLGYTTFRAKYGVTAQGDYVIQIFHTPEVAAKADKEDYWLRKMPESLKLMQKSMFGYHSNINIGYEGDIWSWFMLFKNEHDVFDDARTPEMFFDRLDALLER